MLSRSGYYFPIFEKALKAYNIPEEIKYLAVVESALNPQAVSRVGATGLWQFMFRTAKEYGLQMDNFVDERKDPLRASYAAAAYFRKSYDLLGDWLLAIASFNCGLSNVNRAIEKSGSRNFWELREYLPAETRNYVPAFIAAVYTMKHSDTHKIYANVPLFTFKIDTISINHFVSIADISRAIHYTEETLTGLNPTYRKGIINGTHEQPKTIVIPKLEPYFFTALYQVINTDLPVDKTNVELSLDDIYWEQNKRSQQSKNRVETIVHKVKPGQTLFEIARQYRVSVQDLKTWNQLNSTELAVGQLLKVIADSSPS
jgi:membrane-bound lytic murein transglycosylase D